MTFAALLRDLVNEALDDDTVRQLCFDYFRPLYDQLSPGMSRTECIRRLIEWCYDHRSFDHLLPLIRVLNPIVYTEYAARLESVPLNERYRGPIGLAPTQVFPPCIVHPLPPAPHFVGRSRELKALHTFRDDPSPGTMSMVGLGGAGKTALASEFLAAVLANEGTRAGNVFVWSFYVNQDSNAFLEAAYHYFSGGRSLQGSGAGALYLLIEILGRPDLALVILDGLERVQQPKSGTAGYFGELSDPLLAQFVSRLAAGLGGAKCLITTRFPLPTLQPWLGKTFTVLDIDQLDPVDARQLLRRHQIRGDDDELDALIAEFGAHALTLDHLGGYLREYADGDPAKASALPQPELDSNEPQERRLARVLYAYDKALTPVEHALLARLCIFRFGSTLERLHGIFSQGDNARITGLLKGLSIREFNKILRHLLNLHLVLEQRKAEFTAHPAIRDYFYRAFADARIVHQAVRRHFSALVAAPGSGLPTETETVDLLEELLYHTLESGNVDEAREIYSLRLGTYQHLAWNLGHYSRCIRILTQFPRCPDRSGLAWCYRATGDLDAATSVVDRDDTWWLSMLGCLKGRFQSVATLLADSRRDPMRAVAEFMIGGASIGTLDDMPDWFGLPISNVDCHLIVGDIAGAERLIQRARLRLVDTGMSTSWNDEVARLDLTEAELERRKGNRDGCFARLEKATQWIVRSGSQEHLCALHLGKARLALGDDRFEKAASALREGLHIADQCGFGYLYTWLNITLSELFTRLTEFQQALEATRAARHGTSSCPILGADHPDCRFVWGTCRAGVLQAQALARLGDVAEARRVLSDISSLQARIGDPSLQGSQALLASLP
jgi:hypothetical protein